MILPLIPILIIIFLIMGVLALAQFWIIIKLSATVIAGFLTYNFIDSFLSNIMKDELYAFLFAFMASIPVMFVTFMMLTGWNIVSTVGLLTGGAFIWIFAPTLLIIGTAWLNKKAGR